MSKMRILVATLVALGLAAPAMAVDVKLSGDFNNRFSYSTQAELNGLSGDSATYINVGDDYTNFKKDTKKTSDNSDFFGEIKYRLTATATSDDKKVKGVFGLEVGADKFGGEADFGGDDNDTIEFRFGYLDFEVPFDPASRLKVGLQPVGYNKWVWSDTAGGVKWASKRDNFSYSVGWFRNDVDKKFGTDSKLEYDDVYALDFTVTPNETTSVNAFYLYRESGQEDWTITKAAGDYVLDPETGEIEQETAAVTTEYMDQEHWVGIAANTQAGALFGGLTAIYEFGEIDFEDAVGGRTSYDREAYLVNLEGTTKLDNAKVKLGWLYASGDGDATDGDVENFNSIDVYTGGLGSVVVFDSFADDNTLVTSPYLLDKGLNTVYLHGDVDLNDKASVGLGYLWINAAEDLDGPDGDTSGEKDLGHEFVARANYKIAKGLTTGIAAGYLVGGDAWDELASDGDGDDVFRTDFNFRYKF